jgi:hypothetical protein
MLGTTARRPYEIGDRASRAFQDRGTLDVDSDVLPKVQADAAAIVDDALRAALNKKEPKG